jgi:hypothetical protein
MKTKTLKAAVATALVALAAVPASSLGATKFGAELTPDTQPSNSSTQGHPCELNDPSLCTRVSMEAYGRPDGGEVAPKNGTIKRISVISQGPDTFRFELAKAKPAGEKAKVVYRSRKLHTQGQADPNADTYTVETFKVDAAVKKGMYLATESKRSSMLRCSSGGPNQLLFQPALPLSGPFETATDTDGCWLLLEATIK